MTKFEGVCEGGPRSGQRLAHEGRRVAVPVMPALSWSDPIADFSEGGPVVNVGYYEFDGGRWRWLAPNVAPQ